MYALVSPPSVIQEELEKINIQSSQKMEKPNVQKILTMEKTMKMNKWKPDQSQKKPPSRQCELFTR